MADRYNPHEIEPKWQKAWEDAGLHNTTEDPDRPKWYALTMLPYTSGDLHAGHWYAMAPSDAAARWRRMNGYNVFFPIGFIKLLSVQLGIIIILSLSTSLSTSAWDIFSPTGTRAAAWEYKSASIDLQNFTSGLFFIAPSFTATSGYRSWML